jgi:hypothetical protein
MTRNEVSQSLPSDSAELQLRLIEHFSLYLYHGSVLTDAQLARCLSEGLTPQDGASYVWLGSKTIAASYALDRRSVQTGAPVVFKIDLRQLDPALLRADEQLGYHDHFEQLAAVNPAAPGEDDEEWRYRIYELVSDLIGSDPDFEIAPANVWRSYAETGNLAYAGSIPPSALVLV